ncbi:tetratricopeptide (TPR) repeat protein [Inhella inkyongensis]|uniref:Tetratricopeptide (TPR) repeat protein n=1 Tax=Inhella inkyongensis TaxID=392593 RepID=A0A840S2S1_9BURK|nr:tetratricopeptide repeat protein [Inhella inkyongensis]MBB5202981.1 tetratricopeptide (TPR) repeat protein [Inhella inkyongensis]
MPPAPVAEFMRFTAPDPAALAQRIEEARQRLAQAQAQVRGDAVAILDSVTDLGGMLTTARGEAEALALLREHQPLAEAQAPVELLAWYWNALATALQYLGERAQADVYFEKAVALARDGGWQRIEAMALHHWGRSLVEEGRMEEAQRCFSQALVIREALGGPLQESSRKALATLAQLRSARPQP